MPCLYYLHVYISLLLLLLLSYEKMYNCANVQRRLEVVVSCHGFVVLTVHFDIRVVAFFILHHLNGSRHTEISIFVVFFSSRSCLREFYLLNCCILCGETLLCSTLI